MLLPTFMKMNSAYYKEHVLLRDLIVVYWKGYVVKHNYVN